MTKQEFKNKVEDIKYRIYFVKFDDNKKRKCCAYQTFWEFTFNDNSKPFMSGWQSSGCLMKDLTTKKDEKMFNEIKNNLESIIIDSFNLRLKRVKEKIVKDNFKLKDIKDIKFAFNAMRLYL